MQSLGVVEVDDVICDVLSRLGLAGDEAGQVPVGAGGVVGKPVKQEQLNLETLQGLPT